MKKDKEIELKLRVMDKEHWTELCDFIAHGQGRIGCEEISMAANYFDTEDGALNKARLSYRVRAENGNWVATLKGGGSSEGGLHQRFEWNVAVKSGEPNLGVFAGTAAEALVDGFTGQTFRPVVQTEFYRQAVTLKRGNAIIEAALDRGMVYGGSHNAPILELELELKRGTSADILGMGAELAERFPLVMERHSKFFRGLILAGLANDDAEDTQDIDEVTRAICKLLDLIYEAWDRCSMIDGCAYMSHLEKLRGAASEADVAQMLEAQAESPKWGEWRGGQRAVGALLRCWRNKTKEDAR